MPRTMVSGRTAGIAADVCDAWVAAGAPAGAAAGAADGMDASACSLLKVIFFALRLLFVLLLLVVCLAMWVVG